MYPTFKFSHASFHMLATGMILQLFSTPCKPGYLSPLICLMYSLAALTSSFVHKLSLLDSIRFNNVDMITPPFLFDPSVSFVYAASSIP